MSVITHLNMSAAVMISGNEPTSVFITEEAWTGSDERVLSDTNSIDSARSHVDWNRTRHFKEQDIRIAPCNSDGCSATYRHAPRTVTLAGKHSLAAHQFDQNHWCALESKPPITPRWFQPARLLYNLGDSLENRQMIPTPCWAQINFAGAVIIIWQEQHKSARGHHL